MGNTQPIKPDEVTALKQQLLPDFVLKAFNELIAEKWDGNRSVIYVEEAKQRIESKMPVTEISDSYVFGKCDNNWLDVEPIYLAAGWSVAFDKPGYNETGRAYYTFKKGR